MMTDLIISIAEQVSSSIVDAAAAAGHNLRRLAGSDFKTVVAYSFGLSRPVTTWRNSTRVCIYHIGSIYFYTDTIAVTLEEFSADHCLPQQPHLTTFCNYNDPDFVDKCIKIIIDRLNALFSGQQALIDKRNHTFSVSTETMTIVIDG